MERLNKVIASSGLVSRRAADVLIAEGKVIVNGHKITDLSTKIEPIGARITVNGRPLPRIQTITYMVNKPRGVVCSTASQGKGQIITELVPKSPAVYPVGRLDKESEGLILMTNDGDLSNRLTHPSFNHPKQYRVIAKWQEGTEPLPLEKVVEKLQKGVKLGDGPAAADKVDTKALPEDRVQLYITVHEGRTHLIRRMCAAIDLDVLSLRRIKLASLSLGALKPGSFRVLTADELTRLAS